MAIIKDSDLKGDWLKPESVGDPTKPTRATILEYFTDEGVKFGKPKDSTNPADYRTRHNLRLEIPKQRGFPLPVELNYTVNKTNLTILSDALGRDTDMWLGVEVSMVKLKTPQDKWTIQFIVASDEDEDEDEDEVVAPIKTKKATSALPTPKALPTPVKAIVPPSPLKQVALQAAAALEPVLTPQQIQAIEADMFILEKAGYTFPLEFTNKRGKACKLPKFSPKILNASPAGQQSYYNDLQEFVDQAVAKDDEPVTEEVAEDYE